MALGQERMEVELRRNAKGCVPCTKSILNPLKSLDENTVNLEDCNLPSVKEGYRYSNLGRHVGLNVPKPTIVRKPDGARVREVLNEFQPSRTGDGVAQSNRRPFKQPVYEEKENSGSGSAWARETLHSSDQPKIKGDLSGTEPKRLQENIGVMCKALPRLENKAFAKIQNAVCGQESKLIYGGALNETKAMAQKTSSGGHFSPKRQWNSSIRESSIQMPSTRLLEVVDPMVQEEASCDSWTQSLQLMKSPLLSQLQDGRDGKSELSSSFLVYELSETSTKQGQIVEYCEKGDERGLESSHLGQLKLQSTEEIGCNFVTLSPEMQNYSVPSWAEIQGIRDEENAQSCEEIRTGEHEHVVVIFSVQRNLKDNSASRLGISKFHSLCVHFSGKISTWITNLCREQNIKECLRRLRRLVSYSRRGFVDLKSQNLPDVPERIASHMKFGNEDELKAVLMKINEVLGSMERTRTQV